MPEKSISGMAGVERKVKGRSCMAMLAPGFNAQCDTRIRTSHGDFRVGMDRVESVRTEDGRPARVWVHAFIVFSVFAAIVIVEETWALVHNLHSGRHYRLIKNISYRTHLLGGRECSEWHTRMLVLRVRIRGLNRS
jgi:hypothetical protein